MPKGFKVGGRKAGTPNKITADIKALAGEHAPIALKALVQIATAGESEAARVAAANSILDRTYGKAPQAIIGGDENDPPVKTLLEVIWAGSSVSK